MDALALLCSLHADGPVTLRHLRQAGCSSLQGVETYSAEELGGVLEVAPAVARRLLREARLLRQRLEGGLLEREEAPPATGVSAQGAPTTLPAPQVTSLDDRDRKVIGEVLDRWRSQDEVEPAHVPAPRPPREDDEVGTPVRLDAASIDGLDAPLVGALERAGIGTLEALVDADTLALASTIGRPFATVRRVQFLAARWLPESGHASTLVPPARPVQSVASGRGPERRDEVASRGVPPSAAVGEKIVLNWDFEEPRGTAEEDASGPFA